MTDPCGTRTVVRPNAERTADDGLDFLHFFAAAAMRLPDRAGFRAALRDFDFATAGCVGTAVFLTFLNRHCVLLSEPPHVSTRCCAAARCTRAGNRTNQTRKRPEA